MKWDILPEWQVMGIAVVGGLYEFDARDERLFETH